MVNFKWRDSILLNVSIQSLFKLESIVQLLLIASQKWSENLISTNILKQRNIFNDRILALCDIPWPIAKSILIPHRKNSSQTTKKKKPFIKISMRNKHAHFATLMQTKINSKWNRKIANKLTSKTSNLRIPFSIWQRKYHDFRLSILIICMHEFMGTYIEIISNRNDFRSKNYHTKSKFEMKPIWYIADDTAIGLSVVYDYYGCWVFRVLNFVAHLKFKHIIIFIYRIPSHICLSITNNIEYGEKMVNNNKCETCMNHVPM